MHRRVLAVALFVVAGLATSATAQQGKSTIENAVKHCVDVVHRFPAQVDKYIFENFDAFYNSATSTVQNKAFGIFDRPALYQFDKCMASEGFPLQ
jgi:hypothetical protein